MLDHANEALAMAPGRSLLISMRTASSTSPWSGCFEIVGEAARRVPAEERSRHLQIRCTEIIGLRNHLIHAYDFVDFDILWQMLLLTYLRL